MPKKTIPKSVFKMGNSGLREWIAQEIKDTQNYLDSLGKVSRELVSGKPTAMKFTDDDRPDLAILKNQNMFCKTVQPKIKSLLTKFEDKGLIKIIESTLKVTTFLRKWMGNPKLVTLTDFTDTKLDNDILQAIIGALDVAIFELDALKGCREGKTFVDRLDCYRERLDNMVHSEKLNELRKLAVQIIQILHGRKEGLSFYNAAFEVFYLLNKK